MNRFRIAGRSQLQAARDSLPSLVLGWCRDWCLQEATESIAADVREASERTPEEQLPHGHWLSFSTEPGKLLVGVARSEAWRELLFGAMTEGLPDDAVAQSLIKQAQDDLGVRLARVLNVAIANVDEAEVPMPYRRGSGWLSLRVEINGAALELLVELRLLDGHLPEVQHPKAPADLVSREAAIGAAPVKLVMSLPLAEVPIERLQGLRVGDILRGETPLDTPLQLMTERDLLVGHGYWGRQGDCQAVQLTK